MCDLLPALFKSATLTDQVLVDLTLSSAPFPFLPFLTCLHCSQFPLSKPSLDTDVRLEPLLLLVFDELTEAFDNRVVNADADSRSKVDKEPVVLIKAFEERADSVDADSKFKLDKEPENVRLEQLLVLDLDEDFEETPFTDTELVNLLVHEEVLPDFATEIVEAEFSLPFPLQLGEVVYVPTLSSLCDRFLPRSNLLSEPDCREVLDFEPPELDLRLFLVTITVELSGGFEFLVWLAFVPLNF